MISTLLVSLVTGTSSQAASIELYRGSRSVGSGYWAVYDTFLDSTDADRSKGGNYTLEGGKGRTVLIKFGDLEGALPKGAKVTKATLFLSPSSADAPDFGWIGSTKLPWGEGPSIGRVPTTSQSKFAATWKQNRFGVSDWQQVGATGPEDATPIAGAQMETMEKEVAITGLATAVQSMRDRWYENHGFAIFFNGKTEFFSSQAKVGKPRLAIEYTVETPATGPDLSVQWITRSGSGLDASYQATVKNVGGAVAAPFSGQWITSEKPGGKFQINKTLAPGEETTVNFGKAYRTNATDHRVQLLGLRIFPEAAETNSGNDCVEIYEDAIPVFLDGAKPDADSVQASFRRFNEVYLAESKFSFAPEGALERVRFVPDQASAEIVVDVRGVQSETDMLRRLTSGLTGLAMVDANQTFKVEGRDIPAADPFSGLTGVGDTRNESLIPTGIPMPSMPVGSPLIDNLPIEPTSLLSATEVAAINLALGKKGNDRIGILWGMPGTILLRATDMTGKALDGAELAFYQVDGTNVPDVPIKTVLTQQGGTVILETQEVAGGTNGGLFPLKKNLFGNLKADGSNGTILVQAQINGEKEWGTVKAWQLADFFQRGNKASAILDVRFNTPSGPIDRSANLAKGKLVTDSAKSLPAQTATLADDDLGTEMALGEKAGDWVEIDLGRDRPIGEVQVILQDGSMPNRFDILAYATGQNPPQFDSWVKDLNSHWTRLNQGRKEGSATNIPYRGPMTRSRFIRIVNRSGGVAKIAEVRVFALQAQP